MNRRVLGATALLMVGSAFVATTAETGMIWWGLLGSLCLFFVPALVFDAAVAEAKRQRNREPNRNDG